MKEIVAIIRPNKIEATKDALDKLGFPGITALSVIGRGRQRGIANEVSCEISPQLLGQARSGGMKYVPKRLIHLIVDDEEVDPVISAIIKINQTAQIGDGKIFICPIDDSVRLRTGETGSAALH